MEYKKITIDEVKEIAHEYFKGESVDNQIFDGFVMGYFYAKRN